MTDDATTVSTEAAPEDTPETPAAVTFATKDEYTESVTRHINSALAPKLRKIEGLEAQLAELPALQERLAELEQKPTEAVSKATEAHEIAKQEWAQQRAALEQMASDEKAAHEATVEKYEMTTLLNDLHSMLGGLVTPSGVGDAVASLAREGVFQRREGKTVAINPETRLEMDPKDAITGWLANKPHFAMAAPSGSGTRTAPPKPVENGQNIQNIADPYRRLRAAEKEDLARGKAPYPGWTPFTGQ